jgi:hypothetical protein
MIDIGAVWDRTTEFLSDNLAAAVPLALAGLFVPLCLWSSLAPLAGTAAAGEKAAIYGTELVLGLWMLWGKLAIVALSLAPNEARGAAARVAMQRLPAAIIVWLALGVAFAVFLAPIFLALLAGGYDFAAAAAGRTPPPPGGAALALLILYLPVMLAVLAAVGPRLALVLPAVVAERASIGAIMRSVRLTRGLWLKVFGLVLLYLIVSAVSALATKLVFGSVLRLVFGDTGPLSLAAVLTSVLVAVVSTIFTVLAAAFTAKLYLAVRDAREGSAAPL